MKKATIATVGNVLAGSLEVIESAYRCPEWLEWGRTERTDQIREALGKMRPHLKKFQPPRKSCRPKTIDDVTREEWAQLVRASTELLGMATLMYFMLEGPKDTDPSCKNTIEEMTAALCAIGLKQPSLAEALARIEQLVTSQPGDPIFEEFVDSIKARERGEEHGRR